MADDVVELAPVGMDVEDRRVPQVEIADAERSDRLLPVLDLPAREIDADERGVRQVDGDRQQIRPAGAPKFQDPAAGDGRRVETEQARGRSKVVGMRLREREVVVRNVVV